MTITNTEHFGIQRKIVANMTTESWQNIPHAAFMYEADVTDFMEAYNQLNASRKNAPKITINTILLKVLCEGLKAAPAMNAHIHYNGRFVKGRIDTVKEINISMPMILPNGEMMTINLRDFGSKTLEEMTAYIADVQKRLEKTNLTEAMYSVSLDNTIQGLKKGKILQTVFRISGARLGKHKISTLGGKEKRTYESIPEHHRITKKDIEPGTVTISNLGSIYKGQRGFATLLEIIPPQVSAFGIGSIQERPCVVHDEFGGKDIAIRKILPICIAFDHRALDFGDIVPLLKRLDAIFDKPAEIYDWCETKDRGLHEVPHKARFAAEQSSSKKKNVIF
ncbi:MAG: 2-oxo acid dehydrogenase subunit E2 [Oscillospiraceae bacterium]|jgi:pyruvate dehydrogenase E2 component (dihydrolipoamide acetyltransferase)|nr:2-oxo acid dehydrogenase subunit E2 [Oscillospiraceae bacterium]